MKPESDGEESTSFQSGGYVEWRGLTAPNNATNVRGMLLTHEFNGKIDLEYKTDDWRWRSVSLLQIDGSYVDKDWAQGYRYCSDNRRFLNLTVCGEHYELSFPELYLEHDVAGIKVRAGNQLIKWGTANFVSPTSYFGPKQMRNGFDLNPDATQGVPVLNLEKRYVGWKWNVVVAPFHVPGNVPQRGEFWYPETASATMTPVLEQPATLATSIANVGKGLRLTSFWNDTDISVSAYNGPDRDAVFQPMRAILVPSAPLLIEITPSYHNVTYYGTDFSRPIGDLTLNLEAAYSPNKTSLRPLGAGSDFSNYNFPGDTASVPFVAYTLGFSYLLPVKGLWAAFSGKTALVVEWYDAKYLSRSYSDPQQSGMFTWVINNTWRDGAINLNLIGVIDTKHADSQMDQLMATYQFDEGLELEAAVSLIQAPQQDATEITKQESIFSVFRDKDFARFGVKFHF